MRKVLVTTIATLATAMLFTMTTANAVIYDFTFQSNDSELTATGQFTVNAADEVTGISGAVSGLTNQTISGVTANPSFPTSSYSPDGQPPPALTRCMNRLAAIIIRSRRSGL